MNSRDKRRYRYTTKSTRASGGGNGYPQKRSGGWGHALLLMSLVLIFLFGLLIVGAFFISSLGQVVQGATERVMGELPIKITSITSNPPDWELKERVNILLLGTDQRPDEVGQPTRTDTMLLITIDPYSKTAGMLGIPRDLWVPIPLGDGRVLEDKINTAHWYGDLYGYKGGGPALAKETVQYNLGVKVHYYVRTNFDGFAKMIDTLGGIDVYLEEPLVDDEYPTPDYGTMRIFIPAGHQHLDGERALWFVRSRHQDSDLGRIKRQQQALLAMRQKALALDIIPKLPSLLGEFGDTIKTDMSTGELLALANLAEEIKPEDIVAESIDTCCVNSIITASGAEALFPDRAQIEKVMARVFFDARLRQEAAKVRVLNGSTTPGIALKAAGLLERRGLPQVSYDAAGRNDYSASVIYNYTGKDYTARFVANALKIPRERIEAMSVPTSTVDVEVVLGSDAEIPSN